MCGIFGIVTNGESGVSMRQLRMFADRLLLLSQSRGKDASGVALLAADLIRILRRNVPARLLTGSREYQGLFAPLPGAPRGGGLSTPTALIGHCRMATNGSHEEHRNNQPLLKDRQVVVHNGIIVNHGRIWQEFPAFCRETELDSEVIPSLLGHFLALGQTVASALRSTYGLIEGTASIAVLHADRDQLLLATNNGSLYLGHALGGRVLFFASERGILEKLNARRCRLEDLEQVRAGEARLCNLPDLKVHGFALEGGPDGAGIELPPRERTVLEIPPATGTGESRRGTPRVAGDPASLLLEHNRAAIDGIRRCVRCVLPATFPLIDFDDEGVCNYCRKHQKLSVQGEDALQRHLAGFRSPGAQTKCIVSISGGRDSCFALHYVKNVLKLDPLAYTYDWGMVTDLARKNISRMCGKLGVEHILISADIGRKRRYIRRNVLAWLNKPDLGLVPLFMAGDKQYFYYANQLMRSYRIDLLVMSENPLERSHFKHGFCLIEHSFSNKTAYELALLNKLKIVWYYLRSFLKNPGYLNESLPDTVGAFLSFYMIPHNYLQLFGYKNWDEQEIISTLIDEYHWETEPDTVSTWRIGDGTAPFYNYIYHTVAGFTENDSFRSNQVREGIITRAEALALVREENRPRYDSLRWYFDAIGIDFNAAIRTVNSIPKLYPGRT